jgi:fatty-acid desaturase
LRPITISIFKKEKEMPAQIKEFNPSSVEQTDEEIIRIGKISKAVIEKEIELPIVWKNVILFIGLHTFALIGLIRSTIDIQNSDIRTPIYALFLFVCCGMGITAGAHRLWAHRSYKAKLPFRMLLGLWQTMAMEVIRRKKFENLYF